MIKVFSIRLKQARLMKNLSMDKLCEKIGVSKQSIYKYENAQMMPDSRTLLALSNALDIKVDYFFRPISINIDHIEFRKKAKLGAKNIASIKETVRDKVERYFEIEELNNISTSFHAEYRNVDVLGETDIYPIVSRLKSDWQLGEDGINNLIEILEEHQIKVFELDESNEFDGLSGYINDTHPVIVLNKNFNSERKRFTALHELGHLILSFDASINDKMKERLCDLFASEMLISSKVFIQKIGANRKDISLQELRDIQVQYGISIDALMYKAKTLNIITDRRHRGYCIKKNTYPEFKIEVEKSLAKTECTNRFSRLVYRALACETISISKASTLLDMPINEIRNGLNLM